MEINDKTIFIYCKLLLANYIAFKKILNLIIEKKDT